MDQTIIDAAPPAEAVLQLPFDFLWTPATRTSLESHTFELAAPGALAGWSASQPVTPEMLLAAVFAIELFRGNGQSSIPLRAARLSATGQVLWKSPIRLETAPGTTSRDLLRQTVEQYRRPAGEDREDRAAISWIETPGGGAEVDVLEVLARSGAESPGTDLHLVVWPAGTGYRATFVFNSNLLKRSSIERFAGHLRVLLASLAADLDAPISRLPLLAPAERLWLEEASRGRSRDLGAELVHQSIEQRAAATPEAIAVRYRDQTLTYRELNGAANRLARHLTAQGVGADCRVLVCVEPAFDIVIALLGILKAGAVYVPLDPTYPAVRIRAILEDTQPKLILSRRPLIEKLGLHGFPVLAFYTDESLWAGSSAENPGTVVAPEQTAYIYYTSGTTGKPKGVMASQANLKTYIQVAQERYQFNSRDVMPAIARFSFSISMFELLSPLVAGGTLLILDREHILDLARMSRTLGEVTFFHAGPSLLKKLLAHIKRHEPDFSRFSGVRHASSGGDMIAPELLETMKQIFANADVFVIYGCSEISCMGCTYPVPRDRPVTKTYVGRPFDNMEVRVLDGALNQVPVGVAGEIHFAGGGIVQGYLNSAALTAERFINLDGRRFYRTGDLGRLSEDGWLEILGRTDFQIKLRGMRIELAEVEYALRSAPGVRDGVVMAREGADGEKILVAYVVLDRPAVAGDETERRARTAAIRRHLVERLPDYMVPSTYVELASLPVNHNMKVDRHALPEPERADQRTVRDERIREPESPTERHLASLWKDLLGLERVGLDDCFFELGGQSLSAMEFIVGVEKTLGVVLESMEVLRESLEVLASLCDRRLGKASAKPAARTSVTAAPAGEVIETFHFGPEQTLYGVLHVAQGPSAGEAALICAPLGQEHVRTHFVLNRLARRLASQGVPVLRFDYYGCWDSLGESWEATCERWQRDIVEACRELKRRTQATRVVGIGVRFGATLLGGALERLDEISRLVLWDPVAEGSAYYAELSEMHQKYLAAIRHLRLRAMPERIPGAEELLGQTYSRSALREVKALSLAPIASGRPVPIRWLITSQPARQRALYQALGGSRPGSRIEALDFDCGWQEMAQLSDILPDAGMIRTLAAMVKEN